MLTKTSSSALLCWVAIHLLWIAPAYAQSPSPTTKDACTTLRPIGKFCVAPAKDAAQALSQLFTLESNPLADNPIKFAEFYGQLFGQFINTQVGNVSQGSSLAAFSFERNTTTGALQLKSRTFGPLFSERPQTAGRKSFGFAITTQRTRFGSQDGRSLSDEGLINEYVYRPGQATSQRYTSLFAVTSQSTVFGVVYGVTDAVDVSMSLPLVRTRVEGRTTYVFTPTSGVRGDTFFNDIGGTSSGPGDVTVRAKYNFRNTPVDQWAVLVEQRLPTGDEERLLGSGKGQTKVALLVSGVAGRLAPHGTIGYTRAGKGVTAGQVRLTNLDGERFDLSGASVEPSDEFNYAGGVAFEWSPRVTIAGELVGRSLRHSVRIDDLRMVSPVTGTARNLTFFRDVDNLNLLMGTIGGKINVAGGWLLIANVLFPLTDAGLKMGVTPVIGLQKAFTAR